MISNILEIFNPPTTGKTSSSSSNNNKDEEPCLTCLATSSAFMILGGAYLASGLVFYTKEGAPPLPKTVTPQWKTMVRGGGAFIIGLGLFRGVEAARLAYSEYTKDSESEKKLN